MRNTNISKKRKAPPKQTTRDIKKHSPELRSLANSVGDFIRYWGFRRIHGQLWTQIYLSEDPLSGAELVRNLSVSKALVSPALAELIQFKLISASEHDGRTKKYTANPKVFEVIRTILKKREKKLIVTAQTNFENLQTNLDKNENEKFKINPQRFTALGEMISAASIALDFIIETSGNDSLLNLSVLSEMPTE